jgi:hypothetical protein
MSQRRGGAKGSTKPAVEVSSEEMVPFSESLDQATSSSLHIDRESMEPSLQQQQTNNDNEPSNGSTNNTTVLPSGNATSALSMDARFHAENEQLKIKAWKEGPFATGFVPATWDEEYASYRSDVRGQCMKIVDNDNTTPCGCCSALVCAMLGAGRVGNMAVLRSSTEWVEEVGDEIGESTTKRVTRPRLDCLVGPYWPMLMFVTYPLILGKSMLWNVSISHCSFLAGSILTAAAPSEIQHLGVSGLTLITVIPHKHPLLGLVWAILTVGLISALALTAFRDPGILPRYHNLPPQEGENTSWRWNERAHTYRPRNSWYDPDTAVVVEEFDHT